MSELFFTEPPAKWESFLPLGNGRLGAMDNAAPCNVTLQLNEEGIWSGGPIDRVNPDTKKYLPQIRALVKEGKVLEAQALAFETMSGTCFNERVYQTAGDFKIDFFGDNNSGLECGWPLQHKTPQVCLENYKSTLNLDKACSIVTYTDEDGVSFERRTWISASDDMLFMYVKASQKGKINFSGYLDRGIWVDSIRAENGFILLEDAHGIPFCVGAGAVAVGGKVGTRGFCLTGNDCDEVLFFIDIRAWKWNKKPLSQTEYKKQIEKNTWTPLCLSNLEKIRATAEKAISCGGWEYFADGNASCGAENAFVPGGLSSFVNELFERHVKEYSSYWNRFEVKIGETETLGAGGENKTAALSEQTASKNPVSSLPTPELLKQAARSNTNLVNLYLNFSRYLLISGSRKPGELPTTLQGLWNCYMDPPWGSKYTININTEMNYWPVNMTALSECELPLFDLLERAYNNGRDVAKRMYGCRGYVLHHNTDFWGDAAPQDAWLPGTYWVLGAAWIATHIIEHFEYTQDKAFLAKYYYLMHEACLFFVDFLEPCNLLAKDGKPYLVINPSVSPENSYVTKAGQTGAFSEGCEMDNMILEHLFKGCLKAAEVLGGGGANMSGSLEKASLAAGSNAFGCKNDSGALYSKADFEQFRYVLAHLKKPELNSDGSLMEWNTEVPEVEPGHRHVSHLYGLFPGHTITVEKTPELAEACKKTLKKRLENGGGHTGWSQSWIINFRAQLEQGDEALDALIKLFTHSTLPNLLDNHPPFQIDGNFGSLAAVIRMFVQSQINDDGTVTVKLLLALPTEPAWQNGSVRGVAIKGGWTLDFTWKDGKVCEYKLNPGQNAIAKEMLEIICNATNS
ncbi:MAG: glycoside hydrolase family 95 protein [Treponema sp.]|nr:glycoside hydrolase family 95 protein [Treponema sp.]